MLLLITGGTGVLGRALLPLAAAAGHQVKAPSSSQLDLFDPVAVGAACEHVDAVMHLATRIRPLSDLGRPELWRENDRLRADASRNLVDAALASEVEVYIQPTVTFVYPREGPATEETPIGEVGQILRSALVAEQQAARVAQAERRRGIVLRFGLLDGPGTGHEQPNPNLGATLHVDDAAHALLAALTAPSGIYNVCRDNERVSNRRFAITTGWHPRH
jgi:nucleoside-diphosphate-sugar epimerase